MKTVAEASRALESLLIERLLEASGAFPSTGGAGGHVRQGMFVQALASALTGAGGLGLASTFEEAAGTDADLAGPAAPEALTPHREPLARPGAVTSAFGERVDPLTGRPADHSGVDIAAAEGTPIRALAAGTVLRAGPRGGYGNAVELLHADGTTTLYAHARAVTVREGERVEAGQSIAEVGSTGRSTGPHLHFEVREGGRAMDPARALKAYAVRAEELAGSTRR